MQLRGNNPDKICPYINRMKPGAEIFLIYFDKYLILLIIFGREAGI